MLKIFNLLFIFCLVVAVSHSAHLPGAIQNDWTYENIDLWKENYPECALNAQSPIDISNVIPNASLHIDFIGFNRLISNFEVSNTGHAIQFAYAGDESAAPQMTGSALNGETVSLSQFHFHWGQEDGHGSEHTINGAHFDLELHLVLFDKHKYASFEEALKAHHGVAVLGVFYKIVEEDVVAFENIAEMVGEVAARGGNETVHLKHSFTMNNLLPDLGRNVNFYRYLGSLTTPPCTQGVTWLMADAVAHIGRRQIEAFRDVKDIQHNTLEGNNFRRVQPLNGRIVEIFSQARFKN